MEWLKKLRKKPLEYRKRFVWFVSVALVAVIIAISVFVFKEWKWPEVNIEDAPEISEIVQDTRIATTELKDDLAEYEEYQEEIDAIIQEEEMNANSSLVKAKNNVEVGFLNWDRQDTVGLVTLSLNNFSGKKAILKSFVLYQGLEKIESSREIVLDPEESKEIDVSFSIDQDAPVTGVEIKDASFLDLEASAADIESWSYIFRIEEEPETSPTENGNAEENEDIITDTEEDTEIIIEEILE